MPCYGCILVIHCTAASVKWQSFTQAAEQLDIGKARVSQIVSSLEKELGVRLLYRTTRNLSLTEAGKNYYDKSLSIQNIAEEANQEIQSITDEPSGKLRILAPLGVESMITLLSNFLHQYPKINIEFIESDSYQNLIENRCDIAIRISSDLEDSSLYATKIGSVMDMLVASPSYLDKQPAVNELQDLLALSWVSHRIVHTDKQVTLTNKDGLVSKLNHMARVTTQTTNAVKSFILNDIGFAILPAFIIEQELRNKQLVQILPHVHHNILPLYAVYQNKQHMPKKISVLLDYLKQNKIQL